MVIADGISSDLLTLGQGGGREARAQCEPHARLAQRLSIDTRGGHLRAPGHHWVPSGARGYRWVSSDTRASLGMKAPEDIIGTNFAQEDISDFGLLQPQAPLASGH